MRNLTGSKMKAYLFSVLLLSDSGVRGCWMGAHAAHMETRAHTAARAALALVPALELVAALVRVGRLDGSAKETEGAPSASADVAFSTAVGSAPPTKTSNTWPASRIAGWHLAPACGRPRKINTFIVRCTVIP